MTDPENTPTSSSYSIFRAIGPAIIVASVVVGPGSILTSSRVGVDFGYGMLWALAVAVGLMVAMTALSARLGVVLEGTLCEELARRAGRPFAAVAGISLFLIAACFQFGNNLGVLAAIEPFLEGQEPAAVVAATVTEVGFLGKVLTWPNLLVIGLNIAIIAVLLGFRNLYRPIEKMMMLLVGLMLLGFATNLIIAQPSLGEVAGGLIPQLPEGAASQLIPHKVEGKITDHFAAVIGLFVTTFSVAGAFYQSYLVRKKGWTTANLKQGMIDSTVGIGILGLITMMIMLTAATVLHGKIKGSELKSAADVAMQLEPLFGDYAQLGKALFCLGLFCAAFSSFMVNAMIGGSILADGLGLGGDMDARWPKICTVLALLTGVIVAVAMNGFGYKPVNLVIFAQAMTVLGVPVLAWAMLWLSTRPDLTGARAIPGWMKAVAGASFALTLVLAVRPVLIIWLKVT